MNLCVPFIHDAHEPVNPFASAFDPGPHPTTTRPPSGGRGGGGRAKDARKLSPRDPRAASARRPFPRAVRGCPFCRFSFARVRGPFRWLVRFSFRRRTVVIGIVVRSPTVIRGVLSRRGFRTVPPGPRPAAKLEKKKNKKNTCTYTQTTIDNAIETTGRARKRAETPRRNGPVKSDPSSAACPSSAAARPRHMCASSSRAAVAFAFALG